MARENRPPSEEGFAEGFYRYILAEKVIDADSWDKLFQELNRNEIFKDGAQRLFEEFRIFNLVIVIEGSLAELLGHYFRMGKLNNPEILLQQVKDRIKKRYKTMAEDVISQQTEGREDGLLSRPVLQYFCGYTLGDLVTIFRVHTPFPKNFELDKFNDLRISFIHLMLTGRTSINLEEIYNLGKGIQKEVHSVIEEYIKKDNQSLIKHSTSI